MKFGNALLYRIMNAAALPSLDVIEQALSALPFAPCGATQIESSGWVAPREENGPMVESVAGQWFAKMMIETKAVPASAVKRKLAERVKQIEETTGRKPGRKESKELKEDITLELLPVAFPKQVAIGVWIDPKRGTLVLDTPSQTRADTVATSLVKAIEGLALSLSHTATEPSAAMASWLVEQEAPDGFTIDRDCELRATDESKAVVRYANHPLDIDEVREHVQDGKRPVRLAMTFDDRVSFTLTEGGTIRGLEFLDGTVKEENNGADEFDTNATIAAGELAALIARLTAALGGEAQATIQDAEAEAA